MVVITNSGPRGVKSTQPHNPDSLLRTLKEGWGLPLLLREAAKAAPTTDVFGP